MTDMQTPDQRVFYLQVGVTESGPMCALDAYLHLCKFHAKLVRDFGKKQLWDFCTNGNADYSLHIGKSAVFAEGYALNLGTDYACVEEYDGGEVTLFYYRKHPVS